MSLKSMALLSPLNPSRTGCGLPTKNVVNPACLPTKNVDKPACLPPKMLSILPTYLQKCWQSCLPTSKNVGKLACLPPKMSASLPACLLENRAVSLSAYLQKMYNLSCPIASRRGKKEKLRGFLGGRQTSLPTFLEAGRQACRHFWR